MKLEEKFIEQVRLVKDPLLADLLTDTEVVEWGSGNYGVFDPEKTILIGEQTGVYDIFSEFSRFRIRQFVQLDRADLISGIIASVVLLKRPSLFMKAPLRFILGGVTGEFEQREKSFRRLILPFRKSEDRQLISLQVEKFMSQHDVAKKCLEAALLIVDELLSNALFDAPIDDDGRHLYRADQPVFATVTFDSGKEGRLFIVHDDERLVIGCEDPYGSIEPDAFLDTLLQTYDPTRQYASECRLPGLGCKLLIDNSLSFYVVSRRNVRSMVCCALKLGMSNKKHALTAKNIHLRFL